ncbi:Cof-type HAD-IIB family hydrolase [Lederbergia panacisoli]|uniref:Cof-type HAD-IIB family hydrolase n=1 Tax=Lederbergia panacisoli TaxID=1255251 RepID=UPI00214C713B|nr:Cof-type HAD-IIB family hydrolase [Lederbergia panacisoli]MCR2821887.1 Cof-type HAD-IIB family hydrolase [Lederbergia panacisoli]
MTYKMLCLDIDGTLLDSNHKISFETKKAIQSLPEGFPVILVSARMPKGIMFLHNELELNTPIICYSGALVVDVTTDTSYKPILNKTMTLDEIKKITSQAKIRDVHIGFYKDNEWYVNKMDDWAIQEQEIAKTEPKIMDYQKLFHMWEQQNTGANKVLCMGQEKEIERLEQDLQNICNGELTVYRSKPTYLEIMHHTANKTSAIHLLQEKYTLKQNQIIAVGDNFNDIDMLKYAGLGIAMGNSPEPVKQIANEITFSNDDNGVAKVIQKYLL